MIRVLVADDHPLLRRAIAGFLRDELPGAEVVLVADAAAAMAAWRSEEWSILILDISMPGLSGLDALPRLKALRPTVPVLLLSALPEEHFAARALGLGASGFVSKASALEELGVAVRRALSGRRYVSRELGERLAEAQLDGKPALPVDTLTTREFAVLVLLARGKSVGEIALELALSVKTVSTHRVRAFGKLGLASNSDAARFALRHGLIEDE